MMRKARTLTMKRTFALIVALLAVCLLGGDAYAQATAPSGYTSRYRFRQWASGANPSADSLNANWAQIDSSIRYPKYIIADSIIVGTTAGTSPSRMFVTGPAHFRDSLTIGGLETVFPGVLRLGSGTSPQFYASIYGYPTVNRVLLLPDVGGTFALIDGNQHFTNVGNITGDSLYVGGGLRVGGRAYVDSISNLAGALVVPDSLSVGNVVSSVGGATTEGTFGVPVVVDVVNSTSNQAEITATNISSSTATGDYRISVYLNCDAVSGGTAQAYGKITWKTSGGNSVSDSTATITLSATSVYTHKTFFVRHVGGGATSITYAVLGSFGTGDAFAAHIIAERLN